MNVTRLGLRERLADYREWVEERDRRRFELVLLACLTVSLTAIITSVYIPGLQTVGEGAVARSGWEIYLGVFLLAVLEALTFSLLLHRFNRTPEVENNLLLVLVLLLVVSTLAARLLVIPPVSAYIIPVAALGMVVAVIVNARTALLLVTLTSLNIGLLTDMGLRYALVALLVGALSLYLVSRVANRQAILLAGGAAMGLAALTIFGVELSAGNSAGGALGASVWGLANGFLAGVLTMIALQVLETVFNVMTPLRLLELDTLAHPLQKTLMQVAPGTYNHSMRMGNLAEAAAEAIGADQLLARVGAHYHDIGKTVRPEYFIENQKPRYVDNPHDSLSPSLSKLAITAHVPDGEHLAKVYGLPQPVVDIIKQHHGTSVLAYFYQKAQEKTEDQVYEESYRYEEEKPRSKEAAIIMLADGVEAAVKDMEDRGVPITRRKIQGLIQESFRRRMEDGQLDDSDLTLSDLHKIQDAFDRALLGLTGHRIRYPEQNNKQGDRSTRRRASVSGRPRPGGSIGGAGGGGGARPSTNGSSLPPSATALRGKAAVVDPPLSPVATPSTGMPEEAPQEETP